MRYTISRGSAHSSFSLDVGVAATSIPHSNPISLYTTIGTFKSRLKTDLFTSAYITKDGSALSQRFRFACDYRALQKFVLALSLTLLPREDVPYGGHVDVAFYLTVKSPKIQKKV